MSGVATSETDEVAAAPEGSTAKGPADPWPHRMRLAAVCALLTAAAFLQDPGRIVTDTKLDLAIDPGGWLSRALSLWEPNGWLGQVQNQAYGYLFPLGPFHWLFQESGLPPWAVQRLWWAVLLCAGFLGVVLLAQRLEVGSPGTRIFAGLVYVLSPRFVTTLGPISAETLPMALAPLVVLPLTVAGARTRLGAAAARSALAVVAMGAVNAAATLATLPLAALYILTRERGVRGPLLLRWCAWLAAVCSWWLIALLLLGSVSPPFLDWIESASTTTLSTSLGEVLRGTSHWVAFVADAQGPFWQGGWLLVTNPAFVLNTMVLAGLGLAGLASRRMPERRWLALCVLVGVAVITFGHGGPLAPPWAEGARALLDGPLAPFRNLHKFDPLVRLPLALATAYAAHGLVAFLRARRAPAAVPLAALIGAVLLAGSGAPLLLGKTAPEGAFEEVPGYWREVADYLAFRGDGAAAVVPGASFGVYYWGNTRDEPLQPLAGSPWTVRDAVPLAPAGTIRLLDDIQSRFARAQGGPELKSALQRAGLRYLVVRNDLDYANADAVRPVLVHEALDETEGIRRLAAFGGSIGGGIVPGQRADAGLDRGYPAVEVYELADPAPRAAWAPVNELVIVHGSSEDLGRAQAQGLVAGPAVLAGDAEAIDLPADLPRVATDGYRARERFFGRVDQGASAVLEREEPLRRHQAVRDFEPFSDAHATWATSIRVSVRASSSQSDAGAPGGARPWERPFSSVDGDEATVWRSNEVYGTVGQWLELQFSQARSAGQVRLSLRRDWLGTFPSRLRVSTDVGSVEVPVANPGAPLTVPLPPGDTRSVRITALEVNDGGVGAGFVLAEVALPAASVQRPLVVSDQATGAARALLEADPGRAECAMAGRRPLCAEGLGQNAEESVVLERRLPALAGWTSVTAWARPRPGQALDDLLDEGSAMRVQASSRAVLDPRGRPQAAADGDLGTAWSAESGDLKPTLTLSLATPTVVSQVRIRVDPQLAASVPARVAVSAPDGTRVVRRLGPSGVVVLPEPTRTDVLRIEILESRPIGTFDPFSGRREILPVGISEVALNGASAVAPPAREVIESPCGDGPDLRVGDRRYETSVRGTRQEITTLSDIPLEICADQGPVTPGAEDVGLVASPAWAPARVVVGESAPVVAGQQWRELILSEDSATLRSARVPQRSEAIVVSLAENQSRGWRATLDGVALDPVAIDGWRQGWVVPAGPAGALRVEFAPQRWYLVGLALGVVALAAALIVAVRRPRLAHRIGGTCPPAGAARVDPWLAAILLVAMAGPAGAAAAGVGALSSRVRRGSARVVAVALVLGLAAGWWATHPWASAVYAGSTTWLLAALLSALATAVWPAPYGDAPSAGWAARPGPN